jgi:Kelch motif
MREKQLREFETATLGAEHAAEHAALRRAIRLSEANQVDPEPTRNAASVAAAAVADAAGDPADVGRWDASATIEFPVVAIHAAMLPTGKVMIFSYRKSPEENSAQAWLWDPANDPAGAALERRDPPPWLDPKDGVVKPANIWCSGHTFTADGELVVFGGNLEFPDGAKTYKGLNKVYTFNPWTETWKEQPDMRHGRWYPTGILLPDGRIPILSGWDESGLPAMNTDVEMFSPAPGLNGTGTISLIGSTGGLNQPPTGEFYPHMFAMPSGRSLVVGPDKGNTWFMNTPTADSFGWSPAAPLGQRRLW